MTILEQHVIAREEEIRQKQEHLRRKCREYLCKEWIEDFEYIAWLEKRYLELSENFEEINQQRIHLIIENMRLNGEIK